MNIFVIDKSPLVSATYLDDVRLRKMIVESAQILCTVVSTFPKYIYDYENSCLYKPTHKNHPSVKWASESEENWNWLFRYWWFLCEEYNLRFEKKHLTFTKLCSELSYISKALLPANSEPSDFIYVGTPQTGDVFEQYKNLLSEKWKADVEKNRTPKWTMGRKPLWARV